MRRIENTKKLSLHKETLRTLSGSELANVAGGTLGGSVIHINPSILTGLSGGRGFCDTAPDPDLTGRGSMPAVGCVPGIPNPTISINPSIIIGNGG